MPYMHESDMPQLPHHSLPSDYTLSEDTHTIISRLQANSNHLVDELSQTRSEFELLNASATQLRNSVIALRTTVDPQPINWIAPPHRQLNRPSPRQPTDRPNPLDSHLQTPAPTMPCPCFVSSRHRCACGHNDVPPRQVRPTNLRVIANGPTPIIVRSIPCVRPVRRPRVTQESPVSPLRPRNDQTLDEMDPSLVSVRQAGDEVRPRDTNTLPTPLHFLRNREMEPFRHMRRHHQPGRQYDFFAGEFVGEEAAPRGPREFSWQNTSSRQPPLSMPQTANLIQTFLTQICEASLNADAAGAPGAEQRDALMNTLIQRTDYIMELGDDEDDESEEYADDLSVSEEEMAEQAEIMATRFSNMRDFARSLVILLTQIDMRQGNSGIIGNTRMWGVPSERGYPPPPNASEFALSVGYPDRGQGAPSIGTQWLPGQECFYLPRPTVPIYYDNPTPSSPTVSSAGPGPGFQQALNSRVLARRIVSATNDQSSPPDRRSQSTLPPSDPIIGPLPFDNDSDDSTDSGSDPSDETEDAPSSVTSPVPPHVRRHVSGGSQPDDLWRLTNGLANAIINIPAPGFTLTLPQRATQAPSIPSINTTGSSSSPGIEVSESSESGEDDVSVPGNRLVPVIPEMESGPSRPRARQESQVDSTYGRRIPGDIEGAGRNIRNWLGAVDNVASLPGSLGGCLP